MTQQSILSIKANAEGWVEDFAADDDNCRVLPKEEGGSELQG